MSNLVNHFDLNTKLATLTAKAKFKAKQAKIMKLETYELSYFLGKFFLVTILLRICLFSYKHLVRYSLKKTRAIIYYVINWKSKRLYSSILSPQNTVFLLSINLFRYKLEIKFDKDSLFVEQSKYATKIVYACVVFDLDTSSNNFKLNNFLFGVTNIINSSHKGKWVCTGYGIAFDRSRFMQFL